jgi:hypothetical protein
MINNMYVDAAQKAEGVIKLTLEATSSKSSPLYNSGVGNVPKFCLEISLPDQSVRVNEEINQQRFM